MYNRSKNRKGTRVDNFLFYYKNVHVHFFSLISKGSAGNEERDEEDTIDVFKHAGDHRLHYKYITMDCANILIYL